MAPEPRPTTARQAAVGPQLADGQVLDDAVLDVVEAGVVGVEDDPGLGHVEVVVGLGAPRQLDDGVEPGADPAVLGALLAGALEPVQLLVDRLADVLGHVLAGELGPVLLDDVLAVADLAQLLADGGHLLAQQELALGLLHALVDVVVDALLQGEVGQDVVHPGQHLLQALLDVDGLQDLDLLLEGELGGVAGGVGHLAGVGDAPQVLGEAAGALLVEDGLDDGPVLTSQLVGAGGRRAGRRWGRPAPAGRFHRCAHAGADRGPLDAADDQAPEAAGQVARVLDLADGARAGVLAVDEGHEEEPAVAPLGRGHRGLGLVGVGRQGDDHPRQDHAGGEGHQGESGGLQLRHWPTSDLEGASYATCE